MRSPSGPSICRRTESERIREAALREPADASRPATGSGVSCDRLPDRGVAVGSARARRRRIVAIIPLTRLQGELARRIDKLPPIGTLFTAGSAGRAVLPLKMLAVWLMTNGAWIEGVGVFCSPKTGAIGTTAFVFEAGRDKLLQLAWFPQFYRLCDVAASACARTCRSDHSAASSTECASSAQNARHVRFVCCSAFGAACTCRPRFRRKAHKRCVMGRLTHQVMQQLGREQTEPHEAYAQPAQAGRRSTQGRSFR